MNAMAEFIVAELLESNLGRSAEVNIKEGTDRLRRPRAA